MDVSPPDRTAAELPTPSAPPTRAPSRAARRTGAGVSAIGGLGALVGFCLPWLVFEAVVQVGCRAVDFQTEVYNLYGVGVVLGEAGQTASALAFVTLLCAGAIVILAVMSARRPRLYRIWLLLLASFVGMGALGLLAAFAASGQVMLIGKNLFGSFLGFGPGLWVTTGSLAVALVGGARLHAAVRPRRSGAPIGEIALGLLGIVGLLSSTVAAVVVRPAQYFSLACAQQGNAPRADVGAVYFTTADGLYALDATSGHVRWSCRNLLGGFVTDGAPTLADGALFVASRDGYVYAIRADDARVLWRTDVGGHNPYLLAPHVTPFVANGLVFGANAAGQLYVLRARDGALAWENDTGSPATWIKPTLALANGVLLYHPNEVTPDNLTTFDERTGQTLWQSQYKFTYIVAPEGIQGGMMLDVPIQADDGVIYDEEIANEVDLVARSVVDGAIRWRYPVYGPFTIKDGVVYVAQAAGSPRVMALRARDGALLWHTQTPDGVLSQALTTTLGRAQGMLVADSGRVYLAASQVPGGDVNTIYGFDARNGAILWRHDIVHATKSPTKNVNAQPLLVPAGDALYLLDPSGAVAAFDARTGASRCQVSSGALPATWSPAPGALAMGVAPVDGSTTGLLYVATSNLYAINPANGVVRWQFTPDKLVTPYVQSQGYAPPVAMSFASPIISPPTLAP